MGKTLGIESAGEIGLRAGAFGGIAVRGLDFLGTECARVEPNLVDRPAEARAVSIPPTSHHKRPLPCRALGRGLTGGGELTIDV